MRVFLFETGNLSTWAYKLEALGPMIEVSTS